jgi:hypothetical protein
LASCQNGWCAIKTEMHCQLMPWHVDGPQVCGILFFISIIQQSAYNEPKRWYVPRKMANKAFDSAKIGPHLFFIVCHKITLPSHWFIVIFPLFPSLNLHNQT